MKRKVALVTGGLSGEAQISYKSALTVGTHVDRSKYDVYKIDINATGWWYESTSGEKLPVNKADFSIVENNEKIDFDVAHVYSWHSW